MTELVLIIFASMIFINLFSFVFTILVDELAYKKMKGKKHGKQKRKRK